MNRKVIIIGAGGNGKVIADIIKANNDYLLGYLDDDPAKVCLGPISFYVNFPDCEFVISIGNASIREQISALPCRWYTAIHPSAIVSPSSTIGEGSVVMPNAVINADSIIGKHCIINTSSVVEHDNIINDYAHVSVGAKLGGTVTVGRSTWIGIGAVVINNVSICGGCMIGAGAVVINTIEQQGTYIGIPAKIIKS